MRQLRHSGARAGGTACLPPTPPSKGRTGSGPAWDSVEGCRGGGHDSTGRLEPQPKRRRPHGNGPSSGSRFPCPQPQPAALGSRPAERASVNSSGITGQRPWCWLCGRRGSCGPGEGSEAQVRGGGPPTWQQPELGYTSGPPSPPLQRGAETGGKSEPGLLPCTPVPRTRGPPVSA